MVGDPAGARTQDPNIKSVVLYLLSYRVIAVPPFKGVRGIKRLQKYYFFPYEGFSTATFFSFVQQTLALTKDNNLISSAIHYGTFLVVASTTIDDDID